MSPAWYLDGTRSSRCYANSVAHTGALYVLGHQALSYFQRQI